MTRARGRSDHQDLVTQMKGNPFENVAAAMVMRTNKPTIMCGRLDHRDDCDDRTIEQRRRCRRVDPHELARLFAATILGMTVIGRGFRSVFVRMLTMRVRVKMPSANHR